MMPVQAEKLVAATRANAIATLAAAVITAAGRPHSIAEVVEIYQNLQYALYPEHSLGSYKEWAKNRDETLAKVHT